MKIKLLLAAILTFGAGALAVEPGAPRYVDHPAVVGAMSKDTIRQVIHLHQSEIRECYQAERKLKPGIGGKVITAFQIDVTGAVSHAKVTATSLRNSNVENCMINHLTRWHFPRPDHGIVKVSYPWMMSEHS